MDYNLKVLEERLLNLNNLYYGTNKKTLSIADSIRVVHKRKHPENKKEIAKAIKETYKNYFKLVSKRMLKIKK